MRRNRASANAELADLRAYGNGVFNRINRAYSICIGLGQKAAPAHHRAWPGAFSATEQEFVTLVPVRSRPEQEGSRDAPEAMAAVGAPVGSPARTNVQHTSGATVLPGERTSTITASDMSDCLRAVTHSSGKVFE
jgi:hypothetical protein